jgi:hypothetical protein
MSPTSYRAAPPRSLNIQLLIGKGQSVESGGCRCGWWGWSVTFLDGWGLYGYQVCVALLCRAGGCGGTYAA